MTLDYINIQLYGLLLISIYLIHTGYLIQIHQLFRTLKMFVPYSNEDQVRKQERGFKSWGSLTVSFNHLHHVKRNTQRRKLPCTIRTWSMSIHLQVALVALNHTRVVLKGKLVCLLQVILHHLVVLHWGRHPKLCLQQRWKSKLCLPWIKLTSNCKEEHLMFVF